MQRRPFYVLKEINRFNFSYCAENSLFQWFFFIIIICPQFTDDYDVECNWLVPANSIVHYRKKKFSIYKRKKGKRITFLLFA